MKKLKRIKELKAEGYSEQATVNQIKREFPNSTKSYGAEQKIHELYQEIENESK